MSENLDRLLKESNKSLDKATASSGCDLVTGVNPFPARKGKIWAAISNIDATRIVSITEGVGGTETAITSRSYIGAVDIDKNTLIIFDAPVSSITLSAGSLWVYYYNI
jgi:hypothetical protein